MTSENDPFGRSEAIPDSTPLRGWKSLTPRQKFWTAVEVVGWGGFSATLALLGGKVLDKSGINFSDILAKDGQGTHTQTATAEEVAAMQISPSITASSTPSPTGTSTADSGFGSVLETTTQEASPTMVLPTNPKLENIEESQVWTGEFPFNDILKSIRVAGENNPEGAQDSPWVTVLMALGNQYKDGNHASNSLLTSLVAPFADTDQVFPVHIAGPGLGHRPEDFMHYQSALQVLQNADTVTVDQLAHKNPVTGLLTWGFYGPEHDWDAQATLSAVASMWSEEPELFWLDTEDRFMTVSEALTNAELEDQIAIKEREIANETREKGISFSNSESTRYNEVDKDDASVLMATISGRSIFSLNNENLRCDVFMSNANSRSKQTQQVRAVLHKDMNGQTETFTNADSELGHTLFAGSYHEEIGNDTDGFTARGYDGPVNGQVDAVSGEELLPCGDEIEVTPAPTEAATPAETPVKTPEGTPPPPTPVDTPSPTPDDTPTPPSSETPTPENTPTPIKTVTVTLSPTIQITLTWTNTPIPTVTVTKTPTPSPTNTPVPPSSTPMPTNTHSATTTATGAPPSPTATWTQIPNMVIESIKRAFKGGN